VNTDFITKLLQLDLRQAWIFLTDVLRNPATNVTAFALILAAITKKCHDPRDCTQCHEDHVHPTTLEQLESLGVITGGDEQ